VKADDALTAAQSVHLQFSQPRLAQSDRFHVFGAWGF
jgi:hypothetical protein